MEPSSWDPVADPSHFHATPPKASPTTATIVISGSAPITHLKDPFGVTDIILGYDDRPYGANQFYGDYNSFEHTKAWFAGLHQNFRCTDRNRLRLPPPQ